MCVASRGPLGPRIDLRLALRDLEAFEEGVAFLAVLDHDRADRIHADPIGPFVHALEIMALLAVKLSQSHNDLEALVLAGDLAEQLCALDMQAGCSREMDL